MSTQHPITAEELAALAAGDVDPQRESELREHLAHCDTCRRTLAAIRALDTALIALPPASPSPPRLAEIRLALDDALHAPPPGAEVLTLSEAAALLRVTPEQLGEIVHELPAFELAGQIRIRRQRLLEWIQQRERDYSHATAASWAAHARRDH